MLALWEGEQMNAYSYYKQRPEEILHHDEQVVITFSADRGQPCWQFRDPHTMKVMFTLSSDVVRETLRKFERLPLAYILEVEAEKKRKGQI